MEELKREVKRDAIKKDRRLLKSFRERYPKRPFCWIASARLEEQAEEMEAAWQLIQKGCEECPNSEDVWLEACRIAIAAARSSPNPNEAGKAVIAHGLKLIPNSVKLWLEAANLEHDNSNKSRVFNQGLEHIPDSVLLWKAVVELATAAKSNEEDNANNLNGLTSARAVLTLARNKNPHNPQLWLAATRTELRHGNNKEADILMAKALHECPNSGILWAAYIESMILLPPSQWMAKIMDALMKCDYDPHVIAAVAKLFWHHCKVERARTWLDRAVTIAPDIGDFWALYFQFELQHGTDENQKDVLRRCIASQPKHGEKWQPIFKALHNSHQPTEAILHQVVAVLAKEESSQQARQAPQTDRL
ncbi:protein STABILIZED1-like [Prunus persica]|uniref:protein STABILIZED1-like n=1 Tax=Prunus persica TaxID=3760 RepID=UPI0009AB9843|nr:protein STABILIZED1-like [Prunus persica]